MSQRRMLKQVQRGLVQRRTAHFYQGFAFGIKGGGDEDPELESADESFQAAEEPPDPKQEKGSES